MSRRSSRRSLLGGSSHAAFGTVTCPFAAKRKSGICCWRRRKRKSGRHADVIADTAYSLNAVGWPKDEQRIAQDRAGVARHAPATHAPAHLSQALDAFDDACTPEAVFMPRRIWPLQPGDSITAKRTLAEITQRNLCVTATVFVAFAAEAFVNDFLSVHLRPRVSEKDFAKIDRYWGTRRKYLEAVEIAYEPLFTEGDEVMPAIEELSEVRDLLAHARPGIGPPLAYMPDPSWREKYPLTKVATWLIAVAGAASLMERRCYGFDHESLPASLIWHERPLVTAHAVQATRSQTPTTSGDRRSFSCSTTVPATSKLRSAPSA
jgi:hypothetical protein